MSHRRSGLWEWVVGVGYSVCVTGKMSHTNGCCGILTHSWEHVIKNSIFGVALHDGA